jgi:sulfur carrier protein
MTIIVNDEAQSLKEAATLQELIQALELEGKTGIAVAVNEAVVTRTAWETRQLQDTDRVTIIQATQGG